MEHLPASIFVFVLGACVGSFLNVVHYRLPRNMRLLVPQSSCPSCNHRLRFFRENIPILGWFAVRGKCRYCKEPVSFEYPFVELLTAFLFLVCYVLCYWVPESTPFLGEIFGSWWHDNGVVRTLPMFIALLTLVSGLFAMTVIDARTFTIPIQIPIFMTLVAFLAALCQPWLQVRHTPDQIWPYPLIDWTWSLAAFCGMGGVLFSTFLLKIGVLKYSFSDYEEYVKEDELLAVYPHARREMFKEIIFLLPIMLGFIIGWVLGYEKGVPSLAIQGIAGSILGYLVGGGLVWGIRILGTLGFGKEAMGLGDVHLLAGVGAVVGWWDPVLIFFIAPFSGLLWAGVSAILEKIGKQYREIPYGPHLAIATLLVVLCRPGIDWVWSIVMPDVQMLTTSTSEVTSVVTSVVTSEVTTEVPHEMAVKFWSFFVSVVDLTDGQKEGSIHISPLPVGYGQ